MSSTTAPHDPLVGHPQRQKILAVMCLSLILIVVNVSSLNVALPSIINDLQPSAAETLWIVDSYALVFAGVLLPAGALGDRLGRKGALQVGLALFLLCAVGASFAETPMQLIVSRGLMGIGAGLIMPATLSIITDVFPPHERAKAIAVWSGLAGAGGAIGIIAAGLLLKAYSWSSVFLVNVPIAAVTLLVVAAMVPTSRDPEGHPLDWPGSALSIVGLVALLFGIIEGPERGWTDGLVLGGFALASVMIGAFIIHELHTEHPMLDPRLFLIKGFGLSSLTITISFLTMFGMFLLIAQHFQFVNGTSALGSGLRTLPYALALIVLAPRSPKLTERIGVRNSQALGLLIVGIGYAGLAVVRPDTPYLWIGGSLVVLAIGMAALMPPATAAIVSTLPPAKAGVGSAVNDTTRELGGTIGIALMGTLVTLGYGDAIGPSTAELPADAAHAAGDSIGGALAIARGLDPAPAAELVDAAGEAFNHGSSIAFGFAAALAVVTAAAIRRWYPADQTPQ